jgi:hypothetical protein
MDAADLDTLCLQAQAGEYGLMADHLAASSWSARPAFFKGTPEKFRDSAKRLKSCLKDAPHYRHLFELRQLSSFLLDPNTAPDWAEPWLKANLQCERHLPEMDMDAAVRGSWTAVPVVSVLADGCVAYFITGLVPVADFRVGWPPWADALLDNAAKSAIQSAAVAALNLAPAPKNCCLYCYPLTPANAAVQFQGPSLGLPLALSFLAVLSASEPSESGSVLPRRFLATGAVEKSGRIGPVGHLRKKIECARAKGFDAFLLPDDDLPSFESAGEFEILPVGDLSEAWMVTSLYAPGRGQEVLTLARMLRTPAAFVAHMDHVDAAWIQWVHRRGKTHDIVNRITESPELFGRFTDQVERVLEAWDLAAADNLLGLISPEMFEKSMAVSPLNAFRYCTLNLMLANHRGDVVNAAKWAERGFSLFSKALPSDINACTDFLNNKFVSLHNRYCFAPDWPPEREQVLSCLEKRYAVQCDVGCITDPVLARLYGTLAQNFAFCGPAHLAQCEKYARRAMLAFGNTQVPELRSQSLRQYSYLVYARLDAGQTEAARQALFDYLEIETWADLWSRHLETDLTAWHHAALARFLADSDFAVETQTYFKRVGQRRSALVRRDHPWQLWLHNLGRMAEQLGSSEAAVEMYQESLELCLLDALGPTVRVMALLPLKGLQALNGLKPEVAAAAWQQIRQAAEWVNRDYFSALLQSETLTDRIDEMAGWPQKYFPFSYR